MCQLDSYAVPQMWELCLIAIMTPVLGASLPLHSQSVIRSTSEGFHYYQGNNIFPNYETINQFLCIIITNAILVNPKISVMSILSNCGDEMMP